MRTDGFAALPATDLIDLQAAEWIERRDCTEWSEKDSAEFDAWIAASPAHRIAFLRLDAGWKRAERLAALQPRQMGGALRAIMPAFRRIAASLGIMAMLGAGAAYYLSQPVTTTYATTVGGRQILALDDGSRIEMNTDTVIRVSQKAGQRQVWLDRGEAYFHIRHDAARPFVVVAGDHKVTDLGTTFLVRNDPARFKVALVEGLAQVDTAAAASGAKSALLHPGDVAVVEDRALTVSKKTPEILARELGWLRGVIVFDKTTLAEAAAEFNRYNRRKITIADSRAAKLTIGGTFRTEGVEDFVSLAEAVLRLKVEKQQNEIVISR